MIMAHEPASQPPIKWKLGSDCYLFVRKDMKWTEGEIIGSFVDDTGEWVKVRCGDKVHDVMSRDPDLKEREHDNSSAPSDWMEQITELQQAVLAKDAVNTASIFERLMALPQQTKLKTFTKSGKSA